MAMKTAALAFVREVQPVRTRNFHSLDDSVHITPRIPSYLRHPLRQEQPCVPGK
jgi:hypothetical protein